MQKGRAFRLGLPWLLSAALALAVVWLAVELRQQRRDLDQARQQEHEAEAARQDLQQRMQIDEQRRLSQIQRANQLLSDMFRDLDAKDPEDGQMARELRRRLDTIRALER